MEIIDCVQGSDEWFNARKGKTTASKADVILANGKGLETYIYEIMAEYYSSEEEEKYTNDAMERGRIIESEARTIYELETDNIVQQVGFVKYNDYIGCSPDGLVGEDGLIEIKCPMNKTYLIYLLTGEIDKKYYSQMQMQMLITGRSWCDYVVYHPAFKKNIVIKRVFADKEVQEKLLLSFKIIEEKIKEIKNKMEDSENGKTE